MIFISFFLFLHKGLTWSCSGFHFREILNPDQMELVMMDVLERKSPLRLHNLWHFFFYLASQRHVTIIQRYEPYNNTRKLTQKCARLSCKTVLTVLVRIVQTGQNISHFEIVRYLNKIFRIMQTVQNIWTDWTDGTYWTVWNNCINVSTENLKKYLAVSPGNWI